MSINAIASLGRLGLPLPREAGASSLFIRNGENYVDTENHRSFPRYRPCRNHRLFSALFVAPQEWLSMVAVAGSAQPVAVRMAAYFTSGRQWPYLRCLWRCLCGYRSGLAKSSRWRKVIYIGLDGCWNRFVRNGDHCAGLAQRSLGHDFIDFVRKTTEQEAPHHV
jgi:hypothetical protein